MSGLKDTLKGGWHPKGKDGKSKESWRGDFKGINQVAGWMGKGKDPNAEAREHVSRPLAELKDPSAFGPPPKNVNYHGGAALPNQLTPDRSGLGAPLSREEILAKQRAEEEEEAEREAEEAKRKPPPIPYRSDRTGLSTAHLPPPPGRKDGADGPTPPPADRPKPPGLPPRLPPRQNSNPSPYAPSPPPSYPTATAEPDAHRAIMNQGALSRLGAAGVSVPGFGIGGSKPKTPLPPPATTSPSQSPAPAASTTNTLQLNELQSRFSRFSTSSPKSEPEAPSEGTTWAQKQAALKTASNFRNDPSSVSFSDARAAASTANNFRERHGEQVKSGWQSANKLNTKYGIADKVGAYGGLANEPESHPTSPQIEMKDNTASPPSNSGVPGKKKPPPPPVKRAGLAGTGVSQSAPPPPIPLSSKPKPQSLPSPDFNDEGLRSTRFHKTRPLSDSLSRTSRLLRNAHPRQNVEYQLIAQSTSAPTPQSRDLDLDVQSLWFAQTPIKFPPPSVSEGVKNSYASSSGWTSFGEQKTYKFTAHIRNNQTLASTKIHLTWDGSDPAHTVKAPPPRALSRQELDLDRYRDLYNDPLATWCESKLGTSVGNGECWTLADDGLKAVAQTCLNRGIEPCMPSQSCIHGFCIYTYVPLSTSSPGPFPRGGIHEAGVSRGDIVQYLETKFTMKNGGFKLAGLPDHTSVITGVREGEIVRVVEQNDGKDKIVKRNEYDMSELVKGEVRIFRPVALSWIGELDAGW